MSRLFVVRHTKPDIPRGLCYGRLDVPLHASFDRSLTAIREQLLGLRRPLVYTSPSSRCWRLASDLHPGPICIDEALYELDFGSWEGQFWSQIPRSESDPWSEDFVSRSPPGGESFATLHRRVTLFLRTLPTLPDQDLLCVTHSGVIRSIICTVEGRALSTAFDFEVAFGQVFEFSIDSWATRIPDV